jgi:hypothetical protein
MLDALSALSVRDRPWTRSDQHVLSPLLVEPGQEGKTGIEVELGVLTAAIGQRQQASLQQDAQGQPRDRFPRVVPHTALHLAPRPVGTDH